MVSSSKVDLRLSIDWSEIKLSNKAVWNSFNYNGLVFSNLGSIILAGPEAILSILENIYLFLYLSSGRGSNILFPCLVFSEGNSYWGGGGV